MAADREPRSRGGGKPAGLLERGLHLFALSALAIAQPIFEQLSRTPEFLAARQLSAADIWFLIGMVTVALPAALFAVEALIARLNARGGRLVHGVITTILFLAIGMITARQVLPPGAQAAAGIIFALLATIACLRTRAGRLFVSFLSPAIVVVPALFVLDPEVSPLLFPSDQLSVAEAEPQGAGAPIVFVVFDELPTAALMGADGRIDAALFPNFAALADAAYWFRNATTVATSTVLAVPAMVTGRYPDEFRMPYARHYPDNLFTWLAPDYALHVKESASNLCTARACRAQRRLASAVRRRLLVVDLAAVYLNIVAPEPLLPYLPVVTQSWKGFWAASPEARLGMYELRLQQLDAFAANIVPTDRPSLDFIHINFPHIPYEYLPSGKRYQNAWTMPGLDVIRDRWGDSEWAAVQAYQRYLLQLAATDAWIGRLLDHLERTGLYDRTLIVVTADHGVSFRPNRGRRDPPPVSNLDESILPVPLLIKLPGQRRGIVSNANAETIDILPTLSDALDRPLPWAVDGVSLLKSAKSGRKRALWSYKDLKVHEIDVENLDWSRALEWKLSHFPAGRGVKGLYRIGEHAELIGRPLQALPVEAREDLQVALEQSTYFSDYDPAGSFVPAHITGTVHWTGSAFDALVVAVNGVVAAITRPVPDEDGGQRFSAVVPEGAFRAGANEIDVLAIVGDRDDLRLMAGGADETRAGYRLSGDTLLDPEGKPIPLVSEGIDGAIDHVNRRNDLIEIMGWAVDAQDRKKVEAVLVFDDQRVVYQGTTNMVREETHQYDILEPLGFQVLLPLPNSAAQPQSLRVFALARGVARELTRNDRPEPD